MGLSAEETLSLAAQPEKLQQEYRLRFSGLDRYRDAVWSVLCNDFFDPMIGPDAQVLDVGCGYGEFVNNVSAAGRWGMDLNPDAGSRLAPEVQFVHQDCSKRWPLDDNSLDVVFSSNFLEHLPDKNAIEATLDEALRCLKPGGKIILLGPNIRFVPGEYWDFWDHYVPLTDRSMAEGLRLRGFVVDQRIDRFLPYSMSEGSTPPLFLVRLYLRLRFAWRWFGKQFLVTAHKAGPNDG